MNFNYKVYEATKRIPRGRVTTYSEIAKAIKNPKSYRAVGNALNKNPFAPQVPCHRVIRKDGSIGGFASGTKKKIQILESEGIKIKDNKVVNLKSVLFKF